MIISRTPFRISFFGGGTDYRTWCEEYGGSVISTAIDKYCYLMVRVLPPFFEHRHRIVWSRLETVKETSDIQHPAVRAVLKEFDIEDGLEIHHDADLPARSGLGSSSSFMVGLLHSLHALQGRMVSQEALAKEAIHFEQNVLKENVGSQDQIAAAYGGFNRINFHRDGTFSVLPIALSAERMKEFKESIILVYSGISRFASDIARDKVSNMPNRVKELTTMQEMVDEAMSLLQDPREPIDRLGALMADSWKLKRSLAASVSNPQVNDIYESALEAGASGGKLMGAGGGGFFMFLVRPALQKRFLERMRKLIRVRVNFDSGGSRIIFYDPNASDYQKGERD